RRHIACGTGRAEKAAGSRSLYSRCSGELRIREAGAGGRHQRRPGDTTSVWKRETRNAERGTVAVGTGARAPGRQERVELQSGGDGAGGADMRGAETEMPAVPSQGSMQNRQS